MSRRRFYCRDITLCFFKLHWLLFSSRHQPSCHDITLCCCRLHWLFMMSRLQFSCPDITLFNFCFFLSYLCCNPCRDLHQFLVDLSDVATSELDCVSLKSASISQLSLTAFSPTYCCIFLLSFSFPANDELVSFFLFLYINYSFLDEN